MYPLPCGRKSKKVKISSDDATEQYGASKSHRLAFVKFLQMPKIFSMYDSRRWRENPFHATRPSSLMYVEWTKKFFQDPQSYCIDPVIVPKVRHELHDAIQQASPEIHIKIPV